MNQNTFESHIDLLVTGELGHQDRKSLIEWMEQEPSRWRTCGLAFLEAQLWRESMQTAERNHLPHLPVQDLKVLHSMNPPEIHHRSKRAVSASPWVAVAASILAAFGLGWWMGSPLPMQPPEQIGKVPMETVKESDSQHNLAAESSTNPYPMNSPAKEPMNPALASAEKNRFMDLGRSKISDYERQVLARRGIELSMERSYVSTKGPDGNLLAVPVDRMVAKRVGFKVN